MYNRQRDVVLTYQPAQRQLSSKFTSQNSELRFLPDSHDPAPGWVSFHIPDDSQLTVTVQYIAEMLKRDVKFSREWCEWCEWFRSDPAEETCFPMFHLPLLSHNPAGTQT